MVSTHLTAICNCRLPLPGKRVAMLDAHGLEPLPKRVLAKDGKAFDELRARLRPYPRGKVCERLGTRAGCNSVTPLDPCTKEQAP
jgi:hypothetical protein